MTPFEQFKQDYQGKKVLIFGLGIQGRGVGDAEIFAQIGAEVTITDQKTEEKLTATISRLSTYNIKYTLGEHKSEDVLSSDVIIRNASVPWNHPLLELAREKNIKIHTDESLFFTYAKPNVVAVTGTRGKSTTTSLIYEILKSSGKNVILAGNLVPTASLSLLPSHAPENIYVFELSSWQLQIFHQEKISPHISVITNIYPDHLLDRSYEEYAEDKAAIFKYQSPEDYVLLNAQNELTSKFKTQIVSNLILFDKNNVPSDWSPKIPGDHNLFNIAAAIKVAEIFNIPKDTIKSVVESFSGLHYRLEKIATLNGVDIINDTTSTTPIATVTALNTYPNSILIMGGTTKKLPTEELISTVISKTKALILLPGTGTDEIMSNLGSKNYVAASTLEEALESALKVSTAGDKILFSPGFTSFGSFANEFDRGEQFNQTVENYQKTLAQ